MDRDAQDREERINIMRSILQANVPIGLGFVVYNYGNRDGEFVMPESGQKPYGGHAIMVCGYSDDRMIGSAKGAFLIRNSWGTRWGDGGYGWMPYDYVRRDIAWDIWALFKAEYLDESAFG